MARKRASIIYRHQPAHNFPPCDMRRYVEMVVGRQRKDMSKAPRVNPAMGVGAIMRNFICEEHGSYLNFNLKLHEQQNFPLPDAHIGGPAGLTDSAMFLWRHHVYNYFRHWYIPAATPLMDIKGELFLATMVSPTPLFVNGITLSGANHALPIVVHNGSLYKRTADHIISHFFQSPSYLADRKLFETAGWNMENYAPPPPLEDQREDEYDDDYPPEDDED